MQTLVALLWQLVPILIIIAIPSLGVLVHWIVKKFGAKLDNDTKAKFQEILYNIVMQGVGYAEQIAKQKEKENQKLTSETKLNIATQYVIDELQKNKIFDVTADQIAKKIEAALGLDTLTTNSAMNMFPQQGGSNEDGSIGPSN